ncbi:MAG: hypothetical protein ACK56I_28390, partial [bacterium]
DVDSACVATVDDLAAEYVLVHGATDRLAYICALLSVKRQYSALAGLYRRCRPVNKIAPVVT